MINNAIITIGFALQAHVNNSYQEDTDENKLEREEIEEAWAIIKKHLRKENEDECPLILQQEENEDDIC